MRPRRRRVRYHARMSAPASPVRLRASGLLLVLPCLALAACSSGGAGGSAGPGTTALLLDDPSSPEARSYLLHPPAGGVGEALPLVVVLHGASSSGAEVERVTGFSVLADREGFIAVYPQSTGSGLGRLWNAGFCCGPAQERQVDDVGFLRRVVADVALRVPVDRQRVYLVGYSNGGMLAHRFAAERGSDLAALAVVGGAAGVVAADGARQAMPTPRMEVPTLLVHGLDDDAVPYRGGSGRRGVTYFSVPAAVRVWVAANRCGLLPKPTEERQGTVLVRSFAGRAPVVVYALQGWKHDWPGRAQTTALGADAPLAGFDAAEVIWGFVGSHRRVLEVM